MSDRLPVPGKPYTLKVQGEHIARGKRGEGQTCAVALAIREAFPGLERVRVSPYGVIARTGDVCWQWTHDALGFIVVFDGGGHVRPRTVTLTPRV